MEIIRPVNEPIVDMDEAVHPFGTTRWAARASYVRTLKAATGGPLIGEVPHLLRSRRLGRPPKGEGRPRDRGKAEMRAGANW